MAEERTDEKTEPATPRRREEARERGHVARSSDLSGAAILLAAVLALLFLGDTFVSGMSNSIRSVLEGLADIDGDRATLMAQFGAVAMAGLMGMAPLIIAILVAALATNLVQVGFIFTGQPMAPKMERIDPIQGFKRIFSLRSLVRLLSGILKVSAVGIVVALTIWGERTRLMGLSTAGFSEAVHYGAEVVLLVSLRAVLVLMVLALFEYAYQRWQYDRDLRMSRHEVREELKRFEGDPRIRERRRAVQRQLALQRMMQGVPNATVVITNPTHVAVAVEYVSEEMEAPKVVAKGAEMLAQRIREIAMDHQVPLVERPELARALYSAVEVGQQIPIDLYQAVAEILAYVLQMKNATAPGQAAA